MSLFSAAAGALACAGVYALLRQGLGSGRVAALLAATLLAFAPSFWGEANVQRVYTLNALFVVAGLASALAWSRSVAAAARGDAGSRRVGDRRFVLTLFLCALGSTNHTVMAVIAIAFGIFAVATDSSLRKPSSLLRAWIPAALACAVGLLPYLYLPLRSRMDPVLDWGNPETLQGMLDVVLRRGFWERAWIESAADLAPITADYLLALLRETGWLGGLLALAGIARGRRLGLPVALLLLVMAGNLAALAAHGSRSDIFIWHRYYIPSLVAVAVLAGAGAEVAARAVSARVAALTLALPCLLLLSGWREFDRSRYRIAEDFASAVLESLPPGSHLAASDDNVLFALIYLHLVEGRRPDVDLVLQGVGKADLPPLRFDPENDPLFFTHHPNWNTPSLEIVPIGVVYRAWRPGRPRPELVIPRTELDGEHDPDVAKDYLTQNLIGHFHYTLGFSFEQRDWLRARAELERAAAAAPRNDVLFYNLGLVYARNGALEDAERAFARSDAINPRALASASKARASEKLAEVTAERARLAAITRELAAKTGLAEDGSAASHRRLAELLEAAGEPIAARGHRLRVIEIEGGR
jgi:tetratricopeptide (TPR) repeat protein